MLPGFVRRSAGLLAASVAVVALLASVPAANPAGGGIDFRSTFDDGTIGPWKDVQRELDRPLADSFRIVSSPTRSGPGAAMFVARQGYSDFGYNEDTMLCCGPPGASESEGSDYWYAWSTMFAEPWYGPYRWGIFAQWHSKFGIPPPVDFNVGVAAISVQLHSGAVDLGRGTWELDRTYPLLNDVSPGKWHDFVVHIHWSAYPRGSIAVWHRLAGELKLKRLLTATNVPTLQRNGNDISGVYTLLGIYRASYCSQPTQLGCTSDRGIQPDTVVYQDEFRRSTVMFPWCLACRSKQ